METVLIPVELCQYVLEKKLCNPFQLYITLKLFYKKGNFRPIGGELESLRVVMGVKSLKTIKSGLSQLESLGWIRFDVKSGLYFVLGFDKLQIKYKMYRTTAVEFSMENIKVFKPFLIAAVIGKLVNVQKRRCIEGVSTRGGTKQLSVHSFPVANRALAKILKVSVSTAFEYKKMAVVNGFATVKKQTSITNFNPSEIEFIRKSIEDGNRYVLKKGRVVIQDIDLMETRVKFKRRKKPNHIERVIGLD